MKTKYYKFQLFIMKWKITALSAIKNPFTFEIENLILECNFRHCLEM